MPFPWREWLIAELKAKGIAFGDGEDTSQLWARWREATEPDRRYQEATRSLERFVHRRSFYELSRELLEKAYPDATPEWLDREASLAVERANDADAAGEPG